MADEIEAARFAALAESYGGDLGRWPPEERAGAFARAESVEGKRLLLAAAALDARLDGFTLPAPAAALTARILSAAPRPRSARRGAPVWRWLGVAGVGFAGAAAGALAVAAVPPQPPMMLDPGYEQTAFGELGAGGEG